MHHSNPPRLPLKFLRWFCTEERLEEVEGTCTRFGGNSWRLPIGRKLIYFTGGWYSEVCPGRLFHHRLLDGILCLSHRCFLVAYAFGGIASLFIALIAFSSKVYRSVQTNPMEALRYE